MPDSKNIHHQQSSQLQQAQLKKKNSTIKLLDVSSLSLQNHHCQLTNFTAQFISFSSKSFNASAGHGSQRKTVINFANCICNTRLKQCARISTFSTVVLDNTGFLTWAFSVHFASFIHNRLRNLKENNV